MLLILLAILMKFVDISKQHQSQCCPNCGSNPCSKVRLVAHNCDDNVAYSRGQSCCDSNGSSCSSSSNMDWSSTTSSKENHSVGGYVQPESLCREGHRNNIPKQLQKIGLCQYMQQQQMILLQQQLQHRRRLQQQLQEQGLTIGCFPVYTIKSSSWDSNQHSVLHRDLQPDNYNENDVFNNKDIDEGDYQYSTNGKGPTFLRGMTEFATNNDTSDNSHLSQPLHNSPKHHLLHHPPNLSYPIHFANNSSHKHLICNNPERLQQHTQYFQDIQHKQLPLNFSVNSNGIANTVSSSHGNSPLHYKKPLNSPNNSPFVYGYDQQHQKLQSLKTDFAKISYPLQNKNILSLTANTHYQQQLNDRLFQQQHLQQQHHQLLSAKYPEKGEDDELSEESLKQNVAIVLNNLDRYNNALRSIILNEEVCHNTCSDILCGDSFIIDENFVGNNNFLVNAPGQKINTMATTATPESDYNSNATTPGSRNNSSALPVDSNLCQQQQGVGFSSCATGEIGGGGVGLTNINAGGVGSERFAANGKNLQCSLSSSHDFTHDNSDYQWFLDYGYRDGCSGMQRSVLSSISGSYSAMGDLIYYDDLAKNIDANLAEVDMESFRAEDIHSLLSNLPEYCKSLGSANSRFQQSLFIQQQYGLQLATANAIQEAAQNMSQTSTSSINEIDNSFCKSELLFSPVKESHISVDSLDMEAFPEEGDIILTCKANKDNYTIAFEGSVLYSDDSFYVEPNEFAVKSKQNLIKLQSNLEDGVKRRDFEVSMSRSDQSFQLVGPRKPNTLQLRRYPSGNNNIAETFTITRHLPKCRVQKSSSLPNLLEKDDKVVISEVEKNHFVRNLEQQLNVSQAISTSTIESCKSHNLLPMCRMPISISASISDRGQVATQLQSPQQQQQRHKHRCCCGNVSINTAMHEINGINSNSSASIQKKHSHISGSTFSGNSNTPAFNLVKLFIKQKSNHCSADDAHASAHTCMDVSSGCWPSSEAVGSSSCSSFEQRLRKKSMNDSGKGSTLSRHEEEDNQLDKHTHSTENLEPNKHLRSISCEEDLSSSSASLTVSNSPATRRRSMPLRNPQLCHLASYSQQSTDTSRSNSDPITLVHQPPETTTSKRSLDWEKSRRAEVGRPISIPSNSEMITRSMQTSCGSLSSRCSMNERYRCIPPSFLAKLNNLGEERQAPIYVIYPNYALPDLGFVKTNSSPDVIFSPFNYQMTVGHGTSSLNSSLKKRLSMKSGHEDLLLKSGEYKHIMDWHSLVTLLPEEYRRRLKHIPEVNKIVRDLDADLLQRPLFCMTPPIRRNRPHICDCAQYFQLDQTQVEEGANSSSGSSQQPSSGYRGSSTLLTDSEFDNGDPLKEMYVYQYEQHRMDSGIETSPASNKQMPPQPMPRGILRKSSSGPQGHSKRNSMIEAQQSKLSKLEKRRSLQEPPYNYSIDSAEELSEVFEEEPDSEFSKIPSSHYERLSRKDLDARARAENFLTSLPRSELKYYAEIAAILESSEHHVQYDPAALKKEVSRVLSQQKKVSFNDTDETLNEQQTAVGMTLTQRNKRFSTPPNSPNVSIAADNNGGIMVSSGIPTIEEQERKKIESNRFKRLQIQWELMSKDSSMLKDLANAQTTKSGGSTPTSLNGTQSAQKSRIPRPVSYPAGSKRTENSKSLTKILIDFTSKTKTTIVSPQIGRISTKEIGCNKSRSPSRIVPPKRYSMSFASNTSNSSAAVAPSTTLATTRMRKANNRPVVTSPGTPKHRVQSPRPTSRVR